MTEAASKWERVVPKRLEQVLDALRKLTRTGAKDYEPIPAEHAEEMLILVRNAVGELELAYAPYVRIPAASSKILAPEVEAPREQAPEPPAAPAAPSPGPASGSVPKVPVHPLKIARFVAQIPKEHLPAWTVHLANRITDEFHETFEKRADE